MAAHHQPMPAWEPMEAGDLDRRTQTVSPFTAGLLLEHDRVYSSFDFMMLRLFPRDSIKTTSMSKK